ncbi:hypothetical protein B0H10DRAFT_2221972 [Mycena sp. CBHHK59/15]|nr:hypothetical protein B0H10DRAFT_2221972 [Mycena sp. CBHHK59/15]
MHLITLAATAATAVFSVVSATTITVKVSENNGLTYHPENLTKNHTVTQSTFADPCQQMENHRDRLGLPSHRCKHFSVNHMTTPLWFFCRQTRHCAKGMGFSVNAPATGKTFNVFKQPR